MVPTFLTSESVLAELHFAPLLQLGTPRLICPCDFVQVAVTTKTNEDDVSTQYVLDFMGKIISQKPSHLGQGTTVSVLKLFKNLPVRRQYYSSTKKCKEEVKKVQELLVAYAIIRPDLRLTLTHNRVVVWQKTKVADHRSALLATLGSSAVANLLPCHHQQEQPEILLDGFFPKPGADHSSTSSSSPDKTFIFVNNRPVQNKILLRQHYAAQYADDSARNRYPHLMLRITVPPYSVDVNLTPDKTQVLLHHKTTNSSSSSSVADDWVLNQISGGANPNVVIFDDETALLCPQPPETNSASKSSESCVNSSVPGMEARNDQLSAETWSRGTALTDPVSGEALQPVKLHQTSRLARCDSESRGRRPGHQVLACQLPPPGLTPERGSSIPVGGKVAPSLLVSTLQGHKNHSVSSPATNLPMVALPGANAPDNIVPRITGAPKALHHNKVMMQGSLKGGPESVFQLQRDYTSQPSWESLCQGTRKRQKKHMETHDHRTKVVSAEEPQKKQSANTTRTNLMGQKRKAPLSNQQLLDELFSAQPPKKMRTPSSKSSQPLLCSMAALRLRLQRLSQQNGSVPRGPSCKPTGLSERLGHFMCSEMYLDLTELTKTQLNMIVSHSLRTLGGAEYTQALCTMEKQSPELDGGTIFSDPRLVRGLSLTSKAICVLVAQLQVGVQSASLDGDLMTLTSVLLFQVVVWQKTKVADHRSALLATLGSSAVANLLPCHHQQEQPEILLDGFFPKPGADHSSTSSSSPDKTFIFVNNRPVQNKDIMKLLRQHYAAQYADDSARNRYPHLMLRITVPPYSVDVNLTPDKTQVLLHHKESVLTAVETMLVSLYGFQPTADTPHTNQPGHIISSSPAHSMQTDALHRYDKAAGNNGCVADESGTVFKAASEHLDVMMSTSRDASLDHQTTNSSSSSSVADDWVLNQISGGANPNVVIFDDETALLCPQPPETNSASKSSESCVNSSVPGMEARNDQLSAETWSRGTALTDPVSGEALQPVKLHQTSRLARCDSGEVNSQSSSNKTMLNAITEKRAGLTAYDLISNRAMKTPQSPAALFEREARVEVLRENPTASLQDISDAVHERWKNLREEDRKKYEEKAKKHMETHDHRTKVVSAEEPQKKQSANTTRTNLMGQKRKAPLSNQQLLDELFSAQPPKKMRTPSSKSSQPLLCSMAALRLRLQRLSQQNGSVPRGPRLVNRLASQSAWVILCGQKLMLLNPFRVEEALLFKRLLENNILPAVCLQNPIPLTDGTLGGAEYTQALCTMEKQSPELDGGTIFSDPRLVANGFKIRFTPGLTSAETHLEVTAMADCVPYFGVADLREVLTAVVHRKAKTVHECRPLKVTNYLQGEAVRLARQLPTNLSRKDVEEILLRMEQQLGQSSQNCTHGRPFLHHLSDVPRTELEAKALLVPLDS
ncbi:PMS1 protein homolog 1 [Thalassophryne amazonica]|uniref:PMS1 protein homolog 1 n=1 Tax=Thalassophryne amazonica TaxID=390379 RepID=UPI00147132D8|nr:PMS1 protein homolog 1 [Thalassophryne amazonica]